MKKLCVFTLYSEKGGSSQYRAYIFREYFEKEFEVKWFSFWNDKYVTRYMQNKRKYVVQILVQYIVSFIRRWFQLNFIAPKCDVVFLQKASIPKTNKVFLKKLKRKNVKLVFDVDDAVYTISKDNSNRIAQLSDCVICGNENLKSYYQQYNPNCIVLPTVENTLKYESFWADTFDKKIIGWIGSKTTIDNFDIIVDALNEVISRHQEVSVAIISNTALDYIDIIQNAYLVPWGSDSYVKDLSEFTIGVMPLKDNKFNRGKCGFKLIQYLNMKKPVIGSGVGVNCEIISGNGIIANTTQEWVEAFEKLLYDRDYYNECVEHIERRFFEKYHFRDVCNALIKILND